jgi:4-alpha-glucanotransferase
MDLFSQAQNQGILTEFTDGQGQRHVTDAAALKIIVKAFPVRTPRRFVDGPVVVRSSLPARTELGEGVRLPVRWKIEAEGRTVAEGAADDRSLVWPEDLPVGT